MGNLTLFIIGFLIFATYMFFLLRMIGKQHDIQKQENISPQNNQKQQDF